MNDSSKTPVPDHPELIRIEKDWQLEWAGMPEFVQPKQTEYAKITVRFRNQQDLDDFCRTIGQKLNQNSQCTWFPELKLNKQERIKYVSE